MKQLALKSDAMIENFKPGSEHIPSGPCGGLSDHRQLLRSGDLARRTFIRTIPASSSLASLATAKQVLGHLGQVTRQFAKPSLASAISMVYQILLLAV